MSNRYSLKDRVCAMLSGAGSAAAVLPATALYCEGWLLRLALDWYATHSAPGDSLQMAPGVRWFTEAQLRSAFPPLPRGRHGVAVGKTMADAVIGHVRVAPTGKGYAAVEPGAKHFMVVEAKLWSRLSPGVRHDQEFDQAARTLSCMAQTLQHDQVPPGHLRRLGFVILAPQEQIERRLFDALIDRESIRHQVRRMVDAYRMKERDWYEEWFDPLVERAHIELLSWEHVLTSIAKRDPEAGREIAAFYEQCVQHSRPSSKTTVQ